MKNFSFFIDCARPVHIPLVKLISKYPENILVSENLMDYDLSIKHFEGSLSQESTLKKL